MAAPHWDSWEFEIANAAVDDVTEPSDEEGSRGEGSKDAAVDDMTEPSEGEVRGQVAMKKSSGKAKKRRQRAKKVPTKTTGSAVSRLTATQARRRRKLNCDARHSFAERCLVAPQSAKMLPSVPAHLEVPFDPEDAQPCRAHLKWARPSSSSSSTGLGTWNDK